MLTSWQGEDAGWDAVCQTALMAYICLNVAFSFPETWRPSVSLGNTTAEGDYRRTRSYQLTVRRCTMSGMTSEAAAYPHRLFFGIEARQFTEYGHLRGPEETPKREFFGIPVEPVGSKEPTVKDSCGLIPVDEFPTCQRLVGRQPHASDIAAVRRMLCRKGRLPVETAMEIMRLAGYDMPMRRLKRAHDPLHEDNRAELTAYLDECWRTLVCCQMLAREIDMDLLWHNMVSHCIVDLWGCETCTVAPWYELDRASDDRYKFADAEDAKEQQ